MAECPHESHDITYKLLSSQHTRKVNDVIMPFFLTAPRSHGPSRERRGSHIISTLVEKLSKGPENIGSEKIGKTRQTLKNT
jgi:hypothetical protein